MGDGSFCAIPQEVLVAVIGQRFSEGEHAVLLALLYRLHRFAKDAGAPQAIGFGGFEKLTGLQRRSVIRCLNSLINRRVISVKRVSGGDPSDRNVYGVNPPDQWVGRHYPTGDFTVTGTSDGAVTTPGDGGVTSTSDRGATPYNQGTNGQNQGSSGLRPSERKNFRADDDQENDGLRSSVEAIQQAKDQLSADPRVGWMEKVEADVLDSQQTKQLVDFDGADPDVDGEDEPPDFDEAPPPDELDRPEDDEALEAEMAQVAS